MYSRSFLRITLFVLGLIVALTPVSNAVVSNRIASAITQSRTPLQHTVSPRAKAAMDLGSAPASLKLEGLTMRFNMTDAQQAALRQLLLDQQNPASPRYHQWLTPQQFGTQFGLSAGDISKVSSWLTGQGFTVTKVANSSTFITFNGTASQVQHAFGTTVHTLSLNGEKHIANLTEPNLPVAIASVVSNISGLNDFRAKPHLRTRQVASNAIHPHFNNPGGTDHFIAPADFYTIYDLNPLLSNSTNGTGITIAVMGQVDIAANITSDVTAFRTAAGLDTSNLPTTTTYGTDPRSPTPACLSNNPPNNCVPGLSDLQESLLDVEWAGAAAPSAKILFVTSTDVIDTSLVQAIDNDVAPIMTVSYGACENDFPPSQLNSLNQAFQQANSQGITIFGPTGDDGATDCDNNVGSATQGLAVDFPGSSPYVTGLGGTMFNEGSGSYWNSGNGANGGSATGYIPEAVWNETSIGIASNPPSFGAGGGGASIYFSKPAWQIGTGVPNDFARDVPDVSLNAASNHDGYLVCVQGSCTGGNFYNTTTGTGNVFGGTSVATPSFAGVIALVEQSLGGGRLGNINPNIYALANSTYYNNVFHDITTGNNNSPCTTGTTSCPNGGSIGYPAGPGYDQASGWGSIDAANLASKWAVVPPLSAGGPPPGDFTLTPTTATVTTKSGTTAAPITFTLTPTGGFTGPVTLTATSTQSLAASYGFSTDSRATITSTNGIPVSFILSAFEDTTTGAAVRLKQIAVNHPPATKIPWYIAGSGAMMACTFLFLIPRRRRWGVLLALILSTGIIGATGCGSSTSSSNSGGNSNGNSGGGSGGSTPTIINTPPGTYAITITATTGTGLVHTATVSFVVQ